MPRPFSPRFVAWIAVCAMLLGALAPSVSRVLAANGQAAWIEVCTAAGVKRIAAADEGGADKGRQVPAGLEADDCPYCSVHAAVALPPTPVAAAVAPAEHGDAVPILFLRAPRPLFAWAASQPRAPPLSA